MDTYMDHGITPPFVGNQQWRDIPLDEVYARLNRMALYVGRWGYKKGALPEEEYRRILETDAEAHLRRIQERNAAGALWQPKAAVAWLPCETHGDELWVWTAEDEPPYKATFPRQPDGDRLCMTDFFDSSGDMVGFLAVTVGNDAIHERLQQWQAAGDYQEYFLWNGFGAELTDALAAWAHERLMAGIGKTGGARFGPGYPACPDLTLNNRILFWTGAARIGVSASEGGMMIPEMSTAAVLAWRPEARLFNI